jgi:predicted DNA-binding transcriptional regulator YafY
MEKEMIRIRSAEHAYRLIVEAMRRRHPVTITYQRARGGDPVVRTIEPYAMDRNADGDFYVRAMDRPTEGRDTAEVRTFRMDRVLYATVHRTAFLFEPPVPKSIQIPVQRPVAEILADMAEAARRADERDLRISQTVTEHRPAVH